MGISGPGPIDIPQVTADTLVEEYIRFEIPGPVREHALMTLKGQGIVTLGDLHKFGYSGIETLKIPRAAKQNLRDAYTSVQYG